MVFVYGPTLAGLFAAEAAMAGTAQANIAGQVWNLPLQDFGATTAPSEFVVIDPSEDVRQKFEVDFTVDPSRFGAPKVEANHLSRVLSRDRLPPREETWFAAAGGPTEPRGIFPEEFDRARGLFRSQQDEEAFAILHGAASQAQNPGQSHLALMYVHLVLEEVLKALSVDPTMAFAMRLEDQALQRRYFILMREIWRFRSRFLFEALLPDRTTADEKRRLVSWAQELQKRAKHFHVDLAEDESRWHEQLTENRRHHHRVNELLVQESLFVRDFGAAKVLLDLLFIKNDEARPSDPEGLLREYRLYRLGAAIAHSLGDREKVDGLRVRALVFADSLLKSAPDRAAQDLLRAAEELSISDEHEHRELDFIIDILSGCLNRIRSGPASHQGVMDPESISSGFFLVAARRIEVLIRQTPLSERRVQMGELQALRQDVNRVERSLPHWEEGGDVEVYQEQADAVLWELNLILVRSYQAAGQLEQAAMLLLAFIADLPEGDHRRWYRGYRLLEEIYDSCDDVEWKTRATAARLQAEAHALVLRARGEEVGD